MAGITVEKVSGAKGLRRFIKLPWSIYGKDPNWVPPLIMDQKHLLDTEKNPFYKHAKQQSFLVYRDGEPVGRIAAVIDENYNRFQNQRSGIFGFFEIQNDEEAARALLGAAQDWLREQKMERLLGPANPSTNHIFGLLVEGFDQSAMVMMPYNPPYYDRLLKGCGLEKAKDLYAYHMDDSIPISDKIRRVTEIIRRRHNITVRSADIKSFDREVELIKEVYNDAWSQNWGFVPWTDEEFEHLGQEIKLIVDPRFVLMAFVGGEIAGFCLTLPDVNQALKHVKKGRLFPLGLLKLLWYRRKINQLRCAIMGVRKKYRGLGLEALFCHDTWVRAYESGFRDNVEISWVLEDNLPMRNTMERWGAIRYKTYRVYQKDL